MKQVIKDTANPKKGRAETITIKGGEGGISLSTPSFQGIYDDTFCSLEIWEGELRLIVWANPEQEEPTHTITIQTPKNHKSVQYLKNLNRE